MRTSLRSVACLPSRVISKAGALDLVLHGLTMSFLVFDFGQYMANNTSANRD